MQKLFAIGRWTRDIELTFTPTGTGVAKSALAVETGFGDKKHTEFMNVVVFGKTAESLANYSGKGRLVSIVGEMRTNSWEKDGKKNYRTEVIAQEVKYLDYANRDEEGKYHKYDSSKDPFRDDLQERLEIPGASIADIDDLPF